jgi:hypothetical protein
VVWRAEARCVGPGPDLTFRERAAVSLPPKSPLHWLAGAVRPTICAAPSDDRSADRSTFSRYPACAAGGDGAVLSARQRLGPPMADCRAVRPVLRFGVGWRAPAMSPKGAAIHQPRATPWDQSCRNQALKGRDHPRARRHRVSPFQGSRRSQSWIPRVLPWAIESCPFGAEEPAPNLSAITE